jgi:hypothetical protein
VLTSRARAGRRTSTDSVTVGGKISLKDISTTDLTTEDIVLTWGSQTFTIPSGNMTSRRANIYQCRNVSVTDGVVNLKIDLTKATFVASIKKASLNSLTGTVDFGISFTGFDGTDQVSL